MNQVNLFLIAGRYILYFLVTAVVGLVVMWVDRKVTARVQFRVGPPWYQTFADFFKLMIKEVTVPVTAHKLTFLSAPIVGFAGIVIVSLTLVHSNLFPGTSYVGDLVVVIYLMLLPAVALIIGALSSGNPLAIVGASREMKLVLSYELPFTIAIFTPLISMTGQAGGFGILRLGQIVTMQNGHIFSGGLSWVIAGIIAFFCIQAKLAFVPFDAPEAECEISGGIYIDYSGPSLALIKLTKAMMLFVFPIFIITIFLGGFTLSGAGILWFAIKYLAIVVLIVLLKNVFPRYRIDQALRFFWFGMFPLSVVGFVLAIIGI